VVKQSTPRDSLLVASTEGLPPVPDRIPTTLSPDDVLHAHGSKDLQEIIVTDTPCSHLRPRVRINDLVPKVAERQVRPLRNEDKLGCRWLGNDAAIDGPESTKNAEKRRFATACANTKPSA
jgi:hypothetical protein